MVNLPVLSAPLNRGKELQRLDMVCTEVFLVQFLLAQAAPVVQGVEWAL